MSSFGAVIAQERVVHVKAHPSVRYSVQLFVLNATSSEDRFAQREGCLCVGPACPVLWMASLRGSDSEGHKIVQANSQRPN